MCTDREAIKTIHVQIFAAKYYAGLVYQVSFLLFNFFLSIILDFPFSRAVQNGRSYSRLSDANRVEVILVSDRN